MNKNFKRLIIIIVYLIIFVLLGAVIYFIFKPEPSCSDGIQNQGEEGIDCGGPCAECRQIIKKEKLKVQSVEYVQNKNNHIDVVIKIYNPNEKFGAHSFNFAIVNLQDKKSRVYQDFILPKETKYIIITDYIITNSKLTTSLDLEVRIDDEHIQWQKVSAYRDPKLVIYNNRYQLKSSGTFYADLTGLLINQSNVDYEIVKVKGVLRDKKGKLVGANYQILNTFLASDRREFHIPFPSSLATDEVRLEVEAETNIFNTDNYLKTKGNASYLDQ